MSTSPLFSESDALYARAQKVAPGGVHSPVRAFKSVGGTPVFFERAGGPLIHSVDGATYIDYCQSFGPLLLGHRDPEVQEAVQNMLGRCWTLGACEPYSLALAEWICAKIPWVEKLRFVSSGTEAVMSALRVARAATGRTRILKFDGCYHGHVDSLLVKAGSGLAGDTASDSAGVSPETAHETVIAPLDDEKAFDDIFDRTGSELAAVIIEPLPANYGLLIQRREFLEHVAKRAKEKGVLLIFDEVISGFRVARGGMAEILGIRPDLVTYGKIVGGGFPVGCYGGRRDLMDWVAPVGPVYQAGTLSANPVGMAAGLATLEKADRLAVWSVLEERASRFVDELSVGLKPYDRSVARVGSIFWIHQSLPKPTTIRRLSDIPQGHAERFRGFFHAALERGVYLAPSGFEVGFLSFAHTEEFLHQTIERLVGAARFLRDQQVV